MSQLVTDEEILAFEATVQEALHSGKEEAVDVLGYGEVTTVLALQTETGRFACKRLPAYPDRPSAAASAAVIREYIEALSRCGLEVIDTDLHLVPTSRGRVVVYLIQPALQPGCLGPDRFRACRERKALGLFDRLLVLLERSVSPRLAPDGQLSNWAFVDERILYLDVSSPFLRDAEGRERLDWEHPLRTLPAPLRPIVRRWVLPRLLNKYYTLRGQVLDLLGNLQKESLSHLLVPFLDHANGKLCLLPPLTAREVRTYYSEDARTYALIQAARRLDRWWQQRVLGRSYPHFLPPRMQRHL